MWWKLNGTTGLCRFDSSLSSHEFNLAKQNFFLSFWQLHHENERNKTFHRFSALKKWDVYIGDVIRNVTNENSKWIRHSNIGFPSVLQKKIWWDAARLYLNKTTFKQLYSWKKFEYRWNITSYGIWKNHEINIMNIQWVWLMLSSCKRRSEKSKKKKWCRITAQLKRIYTCRHVFKKHRAHHIISRWIESGEFSLSQAHKHTHNQTHTSYLLR